MDVLEVAAKEIAQECQWENGELRDEIISKEFCLNVMVRLRQKAPGFNINQYISAITKAIAEKINNQ